MSIISDQRTFMKAGEQTVDKFDLEQAKLYTALIDEETKEFLQAETVAESIKEAVDIIVVTVGYLISLGINPQKAWDLVHATNMAKVERGVQKREDGKILKSEKYLAMKEALMTNIEDLMV